MQTTSLSLLERLRQPAAQTDWARSVSLYKSLLYSWACRLGLQEADAADLGRENQPAGNPSHATCRRLSHFPPFGG
jgi:hypothetical protein